MLELHGVGKFFKGWKRYPPKKGNLLKNIQFFIMGVQQELIKDMVNKPAIDVDA